jgi:hypothetical protein
VCRRARALRVPRPSRLMHASWPSNSWSASLMVVSCMHVCTHVVYACVCVCVCVCVRSRMATSLRRRARVCSSNRAAS